MVMGGGVAQTIKLLKGKNEAQLEFLAGQREVFKQRNPSMVVWMFSGVTLTILSLT